MKKKVTKSVKKVTKGHRLVKKVTKSDKTSQTSKRKWQTCEEK